MIGDSIKKLGDSLAREGSCGHSFSHGLSLSRIIVTSDGMKGFSSLSCSLIASPVASPCQVSFVPRVLLDHGFVRVCGLSGICLDIGARGCEGIDG